MHNAIVNSTGLVAVVALPQFEVLVIMAGIVVLAAAIIAIATLGRLGLNGRAEARSVVQRCRGALAAFEPGEGRLNLLDFLSVSALCLRT
jgi:hypothetical protein